MLSGSINGNLEVDLHDKFCVMLESFSQSYLRLGLSRRRIKVSSVTLSGARFLAVHEYVSA